MRLEQGSWPGIPDRHPAGGICWVEEPGKPALKWALLAAPLRDAGQ